MLKLIHRDAIAQKDWRIGESLRQIEDAINQGHATVGVDPTQPYPTPAALTSISVTAAMGLFTITLVDNANNHENLNYFVQADSTPAFLNARTYALGTSLTLDLNLGNKTLYWRAYAKFPGSKQSPFTNLASAVIGG